jgi:c-di-GMP-binding flagellar brake protein YcgR
MKGNDEIKDRRRYERTEATLVGSIEEERLKSGEFSITTKNISRSGVYIVSPHYIDPFTILRIKLIVNHPFEKGKLKKEIDCEGIIVRVEKIKDKKKTKYGLAIHFITLSEDDGKIIDKFVEVNKKRGI